jgi:lactoylglutathione lyase
MHIFLNAGNGNILAFFELPNSPEMGRDENTPAWCQHIAFQVESEDVLMNVKSKLEADGIEVVGPTDHTLFQSIYFFDPSGHRLELAANTDTPEMNKRLDDVKWEMLEEWSKTKRAPDHAKWMHEKEFSQ